MVYLLRLTFFILTLSPLIAAPQTAASLGQVRLRDVPLQFQQTPLTNALGAIGANVKDGFVVFGIEVATENGREPTIEAAIPGGSTLNEALTVVAMAAPGYKFVVVSPHLINFIPPGSENDPEDLLNLHLSKFRLDDVSPGNFIGNPARYLPELKAALAGGKPRGCEIGPGLSDKAPGITLSGNAVSLRQLLNLVSEASIASAEQNRGLGYGWVYLHERFPSESHPAHAWRVLDVWDPKKRRQAAGLPIPAGPAS